ncbi:hypothetical protein [Dasania marina]|uniref:hypothetical protein n=1 Tax=Dasania marina TaxID=471499 RepID=UPI000363C5EF|nr:hypothetical protein [Dasania marina]
MLLALKGWCLSAYTKDRALIFLFAIIFISCAASYYFADDEPASNVSDNASSLLRDYYRSPLNMSDAYQYCVQEAQTQLGASLQRYAMDDISTRYKHEQGVFFVVLRVDVGSLNDYRKAMIYCDVDPKVYRVSYYKEVYLGEDRSILSRTIEFFSDL